MLMLSAQEVIQCLPMPEAIEGLRRAFIAWERGHAQQPLRTHLSIPDGPGTTLFMPAYLADAQQSWAAVKVVSVFPDNPRKDLPVIQGLVLLLQTETGEILAGMHGGALTAIRTGAVSGLATALLAPPEAHALALFGAGIQARTQLLAVNAARPLTTVRVYARSLERARSLIADMARQIPGACTMHVATSPRDALQGSDLVCTATTSAVPVFHDEDVAPGTHINAVGVFEPTKQEIPAATVTRARVYVDDQAAAMAEAGDLLIPLKQGAISSSHIVTTLGGLIADPQLGRRQATDITLFKSVGLAIQDVVAAGIVYDNARRQDLGLEVDLG